MSEIEHVIAVAKHRVEAMKDLTAFGPADVVTAPANVVAARDELRHEAKAFGERAHKDYVKKLSDLREAVAGVRRRTLPSGFWVLVPTLIGGGLAAGWIAGHRTSSVARPPTATSVAPSPGNSAAGSPTVRLTAANLRGAQFVNIDLSGIDLRNTCLMNAHFVSVKLDNAVLDGADLRGAVFVGTDASVVQGKFYVDARTRFGPAGAPKSAISYDGNVTLPCDS